MVRVFVYLPGDVAHALARVARSEERTLRDQIAFILKKELEWRGLLTSSTPTAPAPRPPTAPTQKSEGKFFTNEL